MTNAAIAYSTEVPVVADVDVLVIGGGPAGIGAAIAAARAGANVALVERYGFLGGNATAGLVGPFMTSFSDDGKTQLVKGVFDELVRRMEAFGGAVHPEYVRTGSPYSGFFSKGHDHVTPFDPEAVKLAAAEMMEQYGVRLFMHSFFLESLTEDNRVTGAIILNKSGLQAIRAKVTVDCSADGDVANSAGAAMEQGRKADGLTQPMTMFFRVAGVDDAAVLKYVEEHPEERDLLFGDLIAEKRKTGEWTVNKNHLGIYQTTQPGVWRVNTSRVQGLDGTKAEDLTKAEIAGRRQAFELVRFFRKYFPGFANAVLVDTATQIGVRETRRLIGEYMLTADDLISGRSFEDVIALYGYPIDIHSPNEVTTEFSKEFSTANIYQLPYRILVPEKKDGLLLAGRCVSATHEALGAIRVMPCAFALGQAAGVGAAVASQTGVEPRHVNIKEVQRILVEQGAVLPDENGQV
ncbi:FAD-dependent oxidoreductase [Paenibacillus thalictri]|uniref:FAD-dependent oxidoreductase n=1 Tax=Paenibacillus thalictri TaxID=2527873 RepID=A0A4Q9DJ50_9BACL|nr:FAD-dependent oxidoreductase [Paenibacillus thalictri]TBL73931.1 FAD-dependent oxidoreductase [Paenibacillus thalictri]